MEQKFSTVILKKIYNNSPLQQTFSPLGPLSPFSLIAASPVSPVQKLILLYFTLYFTS